MTHQHSQQIVHPLDFFVSLYGETFLCSLNKPQQTLLSQLFNPPGGAGSAPEAQGTGDNPRHFPTIGTVVIQVEGRSRDS